MLTLLWLHLLIKLCFFLLFFSEIIMQIGLHSIIWKKYYLGEQNISFAFTSLFYFVVNAYILNFIFIQFVKCGFNGKSNFHSCSFVLVFFFPFFPFISFVYLKRISRLNISGNSKSFFYIFFKCIFFFS